MSINMYSEPRKSFGRVIFFGDGVDTSIESITFFPSMSVQRDILLVFTMWSVDSVVYLVCDSIFNIIVQTLSSIF